MADFCGFLKEGISGFKDRLSWDEYFMSIALLVSCRSPSKRLKVGSVIVKNNRILCTGYNGFIAGAPHESIVKDGHEINTIHSEQNSISDAAKRGTTINDGTIYITHFPCINCCKYIISSGIKNVVYLDDYRNDEQVLELFKFSSVSITKMKL